MQVKPSLLNVTTARFGIPTPERTAATADLRFLNSPTSIDALASHLRESPDDSSLHFMWNAALGLAGVPDSLRDIAIQAMSRQLDVPDFPVSSFFLTIMALLEADPHHPPAQSFSSRRPEFKIVWQQTLSGLARKQGAALASTAETLLSEAPDGETPELKAQVAAVVANSFSALPIDRQMSQLQYNWDELSRQPMLPVLQALIHETPSNRGSPFNSPADLNAMALKRWFELDPEGAVREVAAQLASPNAALTPRSVASLPGGSLPQFEAAWARELVESDDYNREALLAALLVRFGTGSATPKSKAN